MIIIALKTVIVFIMKEKASFYTNADDIRLSNHAFVQHIKKIPFLKESRIKIALAKQSSLLVFYDRVTKISLQ
ncbi:hypothetical protein SDC9_150897 [bioreactor metagenome]|uniref:Uncharacterized protein n=1 Tax=bioreactor metagenome TaxID=1076179 RepID=A0A645ENS0_9ZZZZ